MKLLIALAQASGENMILPTIQLLRLTLITRLLLIPLTILLVVITLVVLIAPITLLSLNRLRRNPAREIRDLNRQTDPDHIGKDRSF